MNSNALIIVLLSWMTWHMARIAVYALFFPLITAWHFFNRFPELWRYEDLSLLSVSSVEEQQDITRRHSLGLELGAGTSRLLSIVPCSSPPPLCPLQGSVTLASPITKELVCHRVSRQSQEASSDAAVWSGSSHNSCEVTNTSKVFGSWGSATRKKLQDNLSCSSEAFTNVHNTLERITYPSTKTDVMETRDEVSSQTSGILQTEYIIVDIPLQMGMGSPYSSSCFILIDRWPTITVDTNQICVQKCWT